MEYSHPFSARSAVHSESPSYRSSSTVTTGSISVVGSVGNSTGAVPVQSVSAKSTVAVFRSPNGLASGLSCGSVV